MRRFALQLPVTFLIFLFFGCVSPSQRDEAPAGVRSDCEAAVRYFKSLDATFVELDIDGSLIGLDSHSKFTDEAMNRLSGCERLEYLSLVGSPITDAGVTNLSNKPKLQRLVLNRSFVTDKALNKIGRMTALQELDLGWTKITDASIGQLVNLKALHSLVIENTLISPEGVSRLGKLPLN